MLVVGFSFEIVHAQKKRTLNLFWIITEHVTMY